MELQLPITVCVDNLIKALLIKRWAPAVRLYQPNKLQELTDQHRKKLLHLIRQSQQITTEEILEMLDTFKQHMECLQGEPPNIPQIKKLLQQYNHLLHSDRIFVTDAMVMGRGRQEYVTAGIVTCTEIEACVDDHIPELSGTRCDISDDLLQQLEGANADFATASKRNGTNAVVCGPISLCNAGCPQCNLVTEEKWENCFWTKDTQIPKYTQLTLAYCNGRCQQCPFNPYDECAADGCDKLLNCNQQVTPQ